MELYVLKQDVSAATKKARAMCDDADVFNPLTFIEEAEREINVNVKDICGSLTECSVNDKIVQMTENEFIMYQSAIINHVDSVTIEEARECAEEVQESNSTFCFPALFHITDRPLFGDAQNVLHDEGEGRNFNISTLRGRIRCSI